MWGGGGVCPRNHWETLLLYKILGAAHVAQYKNGTPSLQAVGCTAVPLLRLLRHDVILCILHCVMAMGRPQGALIQSLADQLHQRTRCRRRRYRWTTATSGLCCTRSHWKGRRCKTCHLACHCRDGRSLGGPKAKEAPAPTWQELRWSPMD